MNQEERDQQIGRFYRNSAEEIKLYKDILELSKKENSSIMAKNIESALLCIEEKQLLQDKIDKMEQEQKELKKIWIVSRHQMAVEERIKISTNLTILGGLLEELIVLEKKNEQNLSDQLRKVNSIEGQDILLAKNVANAYKKTEEKK